MARRIGSKNKPKPITEGAFEYTLEQRMKIVADLIVERIIEDQSFGSKIVGLILEYARYLLKHLSDILLELSNPLRKAAFFAVLFNSTPTYTEINFETPKNSPLPEINGLFRIGLEYESTFGGPLCWLLELGLSSWVEYITFEELLCRRPDICPLLNPLLCKPTYIT
jgi:hypothetical protein